MKSKQIYLATDERNELERFAKTGVRNTRRVNRAKIILALDTSGGRFRWQSMAADGSRNWKRTELSALAIQCLGSKRIPCPIGRACADGAPFSCGHGGGRFSAAY
ncbi:MAG: hypothetical protein FWH21_03980 [Kiritimatiellaeota bacterium]|nr:hypothetical protein [Kiritimatiellota bacterium]